MRDVTGWGGGRGGGQELKPTRVEGGRETRRREIHKQWANGAAIRPESKVTIKTREPQTHPSPGEDSEPFFKVVFVRMGWGGGPLLFSQQLPLLKKRILFPI